MYILKPVTIQIVMFLSLQKKKNAFQHGDSVPSKRFYDCEILDSLLVRTNGRGDSSRSLAAEMRSNPWSLHIHIAIFSLFHLLPCQATT